jgi:predicted DNA-binding transcriptional regulator AlpA
VLLAHLSSERRKPLTSTAGRHDTGEPTVHNTPRISETDLPHVDDEMLTLKEVATQLRVPEATLRYWRNQGKGPRGFRLGRSVRYWRTEVALWVEEQSRNPQAGR